jgi:hypothetical protein
MADRRPATGTAPAPPFSGRRSGSRLQDLRADVLRLAGVSSTRELKRRHGELGLLDFRRKASWQVALERLQATAPAPPAGDLDSGEEFRELFAAIDQTSAAYAASIEQGLELSAALLRTADDLEALSAELREEATDLRQVQAAARRQARVRRGN